MKKLTAQEIKQVSQCENQVFHIRMSVDYDDEINIEFLDGPFINQEIKLYTYPEEMEKD